MGHTVELCLAHIPARAARLGLDVRWCFGIIGINGLGHLGLATRIMGTKRGNAPIEEAAFGPRHRLRSVGLYELSRAAGVLEVLCIPMKKCGYTAFGCTRRAESSIRPTASSNCVSRVSPA